MNHPLRDTVPALKCACGHFARADEVTACRFCPCADHRPASNPYGGHDPQTPPGAEAALQFFSDALDAAQKALEKAANEEIEAELARDAARRRWLLSAECPKAAGPDRTCTVTERDAWVDSRIEDEEREFRIKRAAAKAAAKRMDVLGKQGSYQQSINRSVGTSYQGTGSERW